MKEVLVYISRYQSVNHRLIGLYIFFNFSEDFAYACSHFLFTLTDNFIEDILQNKPQMLINKTNQRIAERSIQGDQNQITKILMDQLGLNDNLEHIFAIGYVLNISIEIIIPKLIDPDNPKCPVEFDANSPLFPIKHQDKNLNFNSGYLSFAIIKDRFVFLYSSIFQKLFIEEKIYKFLFRIVHFIR